jgi:transposase
MDTDTAGGMNKQRTQRQQVSDPLWEAIAPLIPPEPPKPNGGRPRVADRKALGGILFVLRTGIGWQELTTEMGFGSGSTCWRRLEEWQQAGVWARLHRVLLDRLGDADKIDWSRVSVDGSSVAAKRGAMRPGRTRRIAVNRARSAILRRIDAASRSR